MESIAYGHNPPHLARAHIALFTGVTNAAALRARIVHASTLEEGDGRDAARAAVNFAFVDARLVTSRLHLQTAIYQSALADAQAQLTTKTVHSEILWALNPTNNITEALRRFGVSDTSTALIIVRIGAASEDRALVAEQMRAVIEGDIVSFDELSGITDWASVQKYYKLNADPAVLVLAKAPDRKLAIIDEIVTSFVAMKSVAS